MIKEGSKFCQIWKKLPNIFKCIPKWQNFTKSAHLKVKRTMEMLTHLQHFFFSAFTFSAFSLFSFSKKNNTQAFFMRKYTFLNGQPRPLFHLFAIFSIKHHNFTAHKCEKMPCPSSIWHQDLNPWPLEHESSPITTRPGLPPQVQIYLGNV